MVSRTIISEFLGLEGLAVVGASRSRAKFGNKAYRDLKAKGYNVVPVNPQADAIEGDHCYRDIGSLPKNIRGLVLVVPPVFTEKVVVQAKQAGVTHIWMQPGAESKVALESCRDAGLTAIDGQCIMMHAVPVRSLHRFHRFLARLGGKAPR